MLELFLISHSGLKKSATVTVYIHEVHCTIAILTAPRFIYRYLNMDCEIIISFLGWLLKMHAAS